MWHQTWLEAWTRIRDLWTFTDNLQKAWYAQPALAQYADAKIKGAVELAILDEAKMINDAWLFRQGVDMSSAWFIRPKTGTDDQRRDGRRYFSHPPVAGTDFDPNTYDGPGKWKPNLNGAHVAAMITSLESWLKCRSLFPWTSVDTASYETGERTATDELTKALGAVVTGTMPTSAQNKRIAAALLATFDFFPPTLTATRTLQHGAAVAARHVVEHFQCIPAIDQTWRKSIADQFLSAWKTRTQENITAVTTGPAPKKAKTGAAASTPTPRRDVTGLQSMLTNWTQVTTAFNAYYTAFSGALTW